jgi:hypothetical protein
MLDSVTAHWRPSTTDTRSSISNIPRDPASDVASETGTVNTVGSHKRKSSTTTIDRTTEGQCSVDGAPKRRRTTQACDLCRVNHSPCDGKKPCDKCRKRNVQCTYLKQAKKRGPEKGLFPNRRS